jgi:4a-hydroxytetrahydrobiopterin dehydratase
MDEPLSYTQVSHALATLDGWTFEDEKSIFRRFVFATHIDALGFVVRVAATAEVLGHHPEIQWVYNRVDVILSTHDAGGVTAKDLALAAKINALES